MTVESMEGDATPLLGQVVADRYFVEALLGEGGMGMVYRARHVTLEKQVALKVLHGEFLRKQEFVDRFLLEAKAASSIRNEHIIDITDFGVTSEGYVFFAMEYLEGRDLQAELAKATEAGELFPWERTKNIFLQVCEALAAAHDMGIIHRDLKPENIFLVDGTGRSDYVKLLDFGIAKVQSRDGEDGERKLTKTGTLFGTPEYMAPEQARGERPDHRVDVYAMGCLLFQFLTGTVPFSADSFMAILTMHMLEPIPEIGVDVLSRSGAPTGVLGIVEKALSKSRENRFASIRDFATAVASVGAVGTEAISGFHASRDNSDPSGRRRPGTEGDWSGAVRKISTIADDAEVAEVALALDATGRVKTGRRWAVAAVAGVGLIGGAAVWLLGADDRRLAGTDPADESLRRDTAAGKHAKPPSAEASVTNPSALSTADAAPVMISPTTTGNMELDADVTHQQSRKRKKPASRKRKRPASRKRKPARKGTGQAGVPVTEKSDATKIPGVSKPIGDPKILSPFD